jgi:hypothetical protein
MCVAGRQCSSRLDDSDFQVAVKKEASWIKKRMAYTPYLPEQKQGEGG